MTDVVWDIIRFADCIGAILAGVLLWRKTRRRVASGLRDRTYIEASLGLAAYCVGTGLLFGRSLLVNSPGGVHLLLIFIPLLWALKPLVASEITYQRNRRKNP